MVGMRWLSLLFFATSLVHGNSVGSHPVLDPACSEDWSAYADVPIYPGQRSDVRHHYLGRGASGYVFRAEYAGAPSRETARKYMQVPRDVNVANNIRQIFFNEDRIITYLQSHDYKHMAKYFGLWTQDGRTFQELELLHGRNYHQQIYSRDRLAGAPRKKSLNQVLDEFDRVLEAVENLHRLGVAHFDLKPANIWILPNGQVRLLDFGGAQIEKTLDADDVHDFLPPNNYTKQYSAPEVIYAALGLVGYRSDVFSLGRILLKDVLPRWEMLRSRGTPAQEQRVRDWKIKFQRRVLSPATEADATQRFQTVSELRQAIKRLRPRWWMRWGS